MKRFVALATSLISLAAAPAAAQRIEIVPNGSRPSVQGSARLRFEQAERWQRARR